jgi:hypothetical protein
MERLRLSVNVDNAKSVNELTEALRVAASEIEYDAADEGCEEVHNGCFFNYKIFRTQVEGNDDDAGSGTGADEEGSGEPDSAAV